ncbi:MAG: tRNA pseudouridine(55) synthase TruB [Eubacteriaceae bacterium]|nr:tRNA pseudouridine(55) synthase TruB [Eubacteriaceae bacterium]
MDGVFVVNKPADITSFGVCAVMRRLTGTKKAGHTGTLDPMATGVLVVCLGCAGRLIEYMPAGSKSYTAGIRFGYESDTQDIWGDVRKVSDPHFSAEELSRALEKLTGTYMQKTPAFSARKVNGRALYSYARNNEEIALPEKEVTVSRIVLREFSSDEALIDVYCSRGTYIRQLISDAGQMLGCGAVMSSLVRTSTDGFDIGMARDLEELRRAAEEGTLSGMMLEPDCLIPHIPRIDADSGICRRIANGMSQEVFEGCPPSGLVRVYSPEGFIALAEISGGLIKPRKVFR